MIRFDLLVETSEGLPEQFDEGLEFIGVEAGPLVVVDGLDVFGEIRENPLSERCDTHQNASTIIGG